MYRPIYKYEVSVRILYKDGSQELKTTFQQAYSVGDAIMQATFLACGENVEKVTLNNVSPPAEDIRKQESELMRAVTESVAKIMTKFSSKLPEFDKRTIGLGDK